LERFNIPKRASWQRSKDFLYGLNVSRDARQRLLIQIVSGMLAASSPTEALEPKDLAKHAMAYLSALLEQFPDQ
jgi:hypothetical protein